MTSSVPTTPTKDTGSRQHEFERYCATIRAARESAVSLGDVYLQDAGCAMICRTLEEDTSHVVSLDLRGNDIRLLGGQALGEMLRTNRTLRSLCLEWNFLGLDDAVSHITEAMCLNTTLQRLDLRNNQIGPQQGRDLAKMIRSNQHLLLLDLRWNNLLKMGGEAIADALEANTTLVEVHVAGCGLPLDLMQRIEEAVRRNKHKESVVAEESKARLRVEDELHSQTARFTAVERALQEEMAGLKRDREEELKRLDAQLSVTRDRMRNLQEDFKTETRTFEHEQSLKEEHLSQLQNDKRQLLDELIDIKAYAKKQDAVVAKQRSELTDLHDRLRLETAERERVAALLDSKDKVHSDELLSLRSEIKSLNAQLDRVQGEAKSRIQDLEGRLRHSEEMREVELTMAAKKSEEQDALHMRQVDDVKLEFQKKMGGTESELQQAISERARAEEEVISLRQELVKIRVEQEEKMTKLELSLRQAHEVRAATELKGLEERINKMQSDRDALEARVAAREQQYKMLTDQAEKDRNEQETYLGKIREDAEKMEREFHALQSKNNTLTAEAQHKDHRLGVLEQQVERLYAQQERISNESQAALDKILTDHLDQLASREQQLEAKDEEISALNLELRSLSLQMNHMQHRYHAAMSGLQNTLTEFSRDETGATHSASPSARASPKKTRTSPGRSGRHRSVPSSRRAPIVGMAGLSSAAGVDLSTSLDMESSGDHDAHQVAAHHLRQTNTQQGRPST